MRAVLQWKFRVKGGGNTKWGGALKAIGKGGRDMSGVQKLTIIKLCKNDCYGLTLRLGFEE